VISIPIKEMMSPIMASISRNYPTISPITILSIFFAGEFSHKIEDVFCRGGGVFMGLDYGKSKLYRFGSWE
jgi:hypothetical protein